VDAVKRRVAEADVSVSRLTSPAQHCVHVMVCVTGLKMLCNSSVLSK